MMSPTAATSKRAWHERSSRSSDPSKQCFRDPENNRHSKHTDDDQEGYSANGFHLKEDCQQDSNQEPDSRALKRQRHS
jgi:hypothetical protein